MNVLLESFAMISRVKQSAVQIITSISRQTGSFATITAVHAEILPVALTDPHRVLF